MSCMSCSDSGWAKPAMIGFMRLPDLKSASCAAMYCSLWPARRGFCGSVELPSMPWQAPQAAALPWPAVASPGLTLPAGEALAATVGVSAFGMPGVAVSVAGLAPGLAAEAAGAGVDAGFAGEAD